MIDRRCSFAQLLFDYILLTRRPTQLHNNKKTLSRVEELTMMRNGTVDVEKIGCGEGSISSLVGANKKEKPTPNSIN